NKVSKIDSLLNYYYSFDALNGCVLVSDKNKIIYQKAFSKANFEWGIPNTVDTKFEIASITKHFTAIIILQLVEQGKLNLSGTISDYLPDYPKDKGLKISLHQLLTHTSGITDERFIENFDNEYGMRKVTHEHFIALFKDKDLLFEPGTKWSYSNFGYNLLAFIAESVTKKSFDELLKENIFTPSGMYNSSTLETPSINTVMASAYEIRFSDINKGQYYDGSSCFGTANIITTIGDYFLFNRTLLSGKLLGKKYLDTLFSPYTNMSGEITGYSLWYDKLPLNKSDTITIIRTAGTMLGWNSVAYNMRDGKSIVIFLNIKSPSMFEIADNITNIIYDLSFEYPKDNYAHILFMEELTTGIDSAIEHYRDLKKKNCCTEKFRDMNRLGYFYLEKDKIDKAIKVFKLNIEIFPENADGYDSLGEAYLKKGDRKNALENYEKSFQLDPKNVNAKNIIEKMKSEQ
ncbi:MAG: serine hydrolase, partial [bacterium]